MTPRKTQSNRQPYPREKGSLLAADSLFPPHKPPLSDEIIIKAIDAAFDRTLRDRLGRVRKVVSTPAELVKLCIKHLKKRTDPILGSYFYSRCNVEEIFELDAIPYEMQRQRMNMGVFYQYLTIELMRKSLRSKKCNIEVVYDGAREGDVVAEIKTPGLKSGIRIYTSVKKSSDTVGGQDVPGVIRRLENLAKEEKNITRPYLCVFCYATPPGGIIRNYKDSRSVRCNNEGYPFSENCESWEPGFIFPFISGRLPVDIYKLAITRVKDYLPFHTMQHKKECSSLLKEEFVKMDLVDTNGKLNQTKFIKFITEK